MFKRSNRLAFYILRWQLSTPVLYLVMTSINLPDFQKVILANFIGALIFFPVDEIIFRKNGRPKEKEPS